MTVPYCRCGRMCGHVLLIAAVAGLILSRATGASVRTDGPAVGRLPVAGKAAGEKDAATRPGPRRGREAGPSVDKGTRRIGTPPQAQGTDAFDIIVPTPYEAEWLYPLERWLKRWVVVKNTTDHPIELQFRCRLLEAGAGSRGPGTAVPAHPLTPLMYLAPGESERVWFFLDHLWAWPDLKGKATIPEGQYTRTVSVEVASTGSKAQRKSVVLKHAVRVAHPENLKPNATVRGHVCGPAGKPIPRAEVTLIGGGGVYRRKAETARDGAYSIRYHSRRGTLYQIKVDCSGYVPFWKLLGPADRTVAVDVRLERKPPRERTDYRLLKKVKIDERLPCGIVRGQMSKNEKYIVLGPGYGHPHAEATFVYLFDADGNLLWRRGKDGSESTPMRGETWAVDVADDGSYVAAGNLGTREEAKVYVYRGDGSLLWSVRQESREVRISHNKRYLAVGDCPSVAGAGADMRLFDLKSGRLLWSRLTRGPVRQIRFNKDDSMVYVGNGLGYLWAYDVEGNLKWRSYIEGWPYMYGLALSEDERYILTASKLGRATFMDDSGRRLWTFDMMGGCRWASIAKDNSHVAVGSGGAFGTALFDVKGNLLWQVPVSNCGTFTADGKSILVSGRTVRLLSLSGETLWHYPTGATTRFCAITEDGGKIVAADDNAYLYVWEKDN